MLFSYPQMFFALTFRTANGTSKHVKMRKQHLKKELDVVIKEKYQQLHKLNVDFECRLVKKSFS